jgi:hypothetical protein
MLQINGMSSSLGLKKLERRPPFVVKRGDLAVDGCLFSSQRFQGIDKLRVVVVEMRYGCVS